ncbi:MAG: hypothetical protein WCO66_04230 [Candidatus Absconditabacteria bacterium]
MAKPASLEKPIIENKPEQELQTNLDTYKKNIQEIKTSVEQIKQQKDAIEKDKTTLAKEVLDQKQKEIDDKKKEIEAKKVETLALINKIKIDTKLANLDKQVTQDIAADEKYLTDLDVNSTSFWEKIKLASSNVWAWTKENPKTAVAVSLGTILAVRGISKLFKKKDKSEKKESDNKEEKTSWWKKALTWTGVAVGGTWLGRGLLTGKWDFFGWHPFSSDKDKKDGPETTPGANVESSAKAYEQLDDSNKAVYEEIASNINQYYGNAMNDQAGVSGVEEMLGDSEFETQNGKKIAGLVPFILKNRYENIGAMIKERAFYYEILGTEGHIVWDKMKNWTVDGLKTFLMPIAGMLDAATMKILNAATKTDEILTALKADPKAESVMRTVFRKSLSVISYFESRKRKLDYQVASEYLSTKNEDGFTTLSDEDKQEKIADMLSDDEWYAKNIQSKIEEFTNKNILDSVAYMKSKNILDGEIDPLISKAVGKVEKRRKDILGIEDADDESKIQLLKSELKEGKLSAKGKEKLQDLCNTFESDIDNFGRKSWYNQYLPLLEMVNISQDTLQKMQSTGDYDGIVKSYKDAILSILKKSDQGTLTTGDLDDLEFQINDYYKFQKSLVTTQLNLSEARDQNRDPVARYTATFMKAGETCIRGFQLVCKDGIGNKLSGAGFIAGGVVTLDLLTGTLITKKLSPARFIGKHILRPVTKGTFKLTAMGVEKLTGKVLRARLPYGLGAHWYDEHSLRVAVCRGEIDLERAAKVANKKAWTIAENANSKTIVSGEDLLERIFPGKTKGEYKEITQLIKKYKGNGNIYEDIFKGTYDNRKFYKPKDWFKLDSSKMKFSINDINLNKLKALDVRIESFTNPTEKKIFQSMMRYSKDLDQAENLAAMSIEPQYLKLFTQGGDQVISAEKFGKYLAKYSGKIDANEMKAFQKFILEAKNSGKIGKNSELFIRNGLRNFEKLKEAKFATSEIETIGLNASKWTRLSDATKAHTTKMIAQLETMTKNTRLKPFWKGMNKQIIALKDYAPTITPDGLKAMKDMSWLDNVTGFSKLSSEGIQTMSKISYLLRDVDKGATLLKSLQGASTLSSVKSILSTAGVDIAKIDDAILSKIAATKSASKITDIVNYGAEFKAISGFKKLVSNPAMKYAGKVLGRGLVVADFAMVGYDFYTGLEESQRIKQTNMDRGEWREDQAYYDVVTGGLGAVAGACMFIPGAGWIAGGALVAFMGAKEVGDKYYQDIAKFKQNYADFSKKELPAIKQELVSINAWGQGLDHTWIDKMSMFKGMWFAPTLGILGAIGSNSAAEKAKGISATTTDAVRALLYVEELQNNPYATYDLNSPEVLNDPELKEKVETAKKDIDAIVKKRFEYIKLNYIDKKKSIVDVQSHQNNTGISSLNALLENSATYYVMNKDQSYADKNNISGYKGYLEKNLKETNATAYTTFENLFATQNTQLFLLYAQLPYYKQQLLQNPSGDPQDELLLKNCEYFEKYITYKMLGKSLSSWPKIDFDPKTIDYTPINDLLSNFVLSPTVIGANEITERAELLTDQQVLARYDVSLNLGQNMLYDIAKSLNYTGKNDISILKKFFNEGAKTVHGIYCTVDGQWRINENNGLDNDFAKDNELNSLEKMTYFQEKLIDASDSAFTGKMIEESASTNKELAKKFAEIATTHVTLRKNQSGVKTEIRNYLLTHGNDKAYIKIPLDMMIKGTKAGISGLASCVYRIEKGTLLYKTTLPGVKSSL